MRYIGKQKGVVIALVLVVMLVVFTLSITIAGLTTMHTRASLQRNQEIISRQTAMAGLKYAQSMIINRWDKFWTSSELKKKNKKDKNDKGEVKILFDGEYCKENNCYNDVTIYRLGPDIYEIISIGYFKEGLYSGKKLWAKGIKAGYLRPRFKFALFSTSESQGGGILSPLLKPIESSLVVTDAELDGDVGTLQKDGTIIFKPKVVVRSDGESSYVEMENIYLQKDASTIVDTGGQTNVKVINSSYPLVPPVKFCIPPFPEFASKELFNPYTNLNGGYYTDFSAFGQDVYLNGTGTYYIKNFEVRSCKEVNFNRGEYYIENFIADSIQSLKFVSGKYYMKNLTIKNSNVKVQVVDDKAAYLFASKSIYLAGNTLNGDTKSKSSGSGSGYGGGYGGGYGHDGDPDSYQENSSSTKNPQFLVILGTETCEENEMDNCTGYLVFQNLDQQVTINNSSIDGSILAKKLVVKGEGKFSCHTSFACEGQPQLISWEEL